LPLPPLFICTGLDGTQGMRVVGGNALMTLPFARPQPHAFEANTDAVNYPPDLWLGHLSCDPRGYMRSRSLADRLVNSVGLNPEWQDHA
jgi:hypothetical protein